MNDLIKLIWLFILLACIVSMFSDSDIYENYCGELSEHLSYGASIKMHLNDNEEEYYSFTTASDISNGRFKARATILARQQLNIQDLNTWQTIQNRSVGNDQYAGVMRINNVVCSVTYSQKGQAVVVTPR